MMHPNAQMSVERLTLPSSYSGLMYIRVPDSSLLASSLIAKPKSIILTVSKSFVNRMLSGFKSLWIILFSCKYFKADRSYRP